MIVITEGTSLKMNLGGTRKALEKLARIKSHMPGMGAARKDIIERALRRILEMMHASIERRWQADGEGSRVTYIGLVLRGEASQ